MKQVTYELDWLTVVGAIVGSQKVDNGFWQVNLITEAATLGIPPFIEGAANLILPGHIVRVRGFQLKKVPNLDPSSVEVKNGLIVEVGFDSYRNQDRPIEGGSSPGENSGLSGETDSEC